MKNICYQHRKVERSGWYFFLPYPGSQKKLGKLNPKILLSRNNFQGDCFSFT